MNKHDQDHASTGEDLSKVPVSVCFADEDISEIFSELLQAQGQSTTIVRDLSLISGNTRIVTEPRYLSKLDPKYLPRCLVVGTRDSLKEVTALTLAQPLTETKIVEALDKFLES